MTATLALAEEHRADLKKSGLNDETITRAQLHALCPRDIDRMGGKIKQHATSALVIPYFEINGKPNGFERRKLFPAVPLGDGHHLRYWQPPKSGVHLYLPPLLDWQALAADATRPLVITEGEKKALAACQYGLPAIGLGGCYNWKLTLDTGEKIVLPTLDLFAWKDRPLELVPDGDAWHLGREFDILAGFYLLGLELIQRGAIVTFVRLPHLPTLNKTGLDDWLLQEGDLWTEHWNILERIPLDDARFHGLAKWRQAKLARDAEREAFKTRSADNPDLSAAGGVYTVTFPAYDVRLILDRLNESTKSIIAELTVYLGSTEVLSGTDLSLKSESSREKICKGLTSANEGIPWKILIQKACAVVLKRHREGEPLIVLSTSRPVEPVSFLLNPFLYQRKISVIFGDGGLGKSTFGLLLAMLCATGETVAGVGAAGKTIPLYLDFEDDADIHTQRLHAIARAHPELQRATVIYKRCTEPLSLLVPELLRQIAQEGIGAVFVDSLAMAGGGDPQSAESAIKAFRALRQLQIATLIFAHQPKNLEEKEPTIFGSVFNKNLARSVWELRKEQDVEAQHLLLGLFHRKANLRPLHAPLGFRMSCDRDTSRIKYEPTNLEDSTTLAAALPFMTRLKAALRFDDGKTDATLAEELGAKLKTVQTRLSDLKAERYADK